MPPTGPVARIGPGGKRGAFTADYHRFNLFEPYDLTGLLVAGAVFGSVADGGVSKRTVTLESQMAEGLTPVIRGRNFHQADDGALDRGEVNRVSFERDGTPLLVPKGVGGSSPPALQSAMIAAHGGEAGVAVNLAEGWALDGFGDRDRISGFENVRGGDADDILVGDAAANELEGGKGDDRLTGGEGADLFLFVGKRLGADVITDFAQGEDLIAIDAPRIDRLGALDITYLDNGALVEWKGTSLRVQGDFDTLTEADFLF